MENAKQMSKPSSTNASAPAETCNARSIMAAAVIANSRFLLSVVLMSSRPVARRCPPAPVPEWWRRHLWTFQATLPQGTPQRELFSERQRANQRRKRARATGDPLCQFDFIIKQMRVQIWKLSS